MPSQRTCSNAITSSHPIAFSAGIRGLVLLLVQGELIHGGRNDGNYKAANYLLGNRSAGASSGVFTAGPLYDGTSYPRMALWIHHTDYSREVPAEPLHSFRSCPRNGGFSCDRRARQTPIV